MGLLGTVKRLEIDSTGFGCCANFDIGAVGNVNCYILLAKSYEPYCLVNEVDAFVGDYEMTTIKIGDRIGLGLSIVFVNSCVKVSNNSKESFGQPIKYSSHTEIIASIQKIINEYTIICSIDKLGDDILIDFEESIVGLAEHDMIRFSGEIKIECIK